MRMDARRAALPNGGSIRKPLAKADAAFDPTQGKGRLRGALRRCRSLIGISQQRS
jgi:hypothetical protein